MALGIVERWEDLAALKLILEMLNDNLLNQICHHKSRRDICQNLCSLDEAREIDACVPPQVRQRVQS